MVRVSDQVKTGSIIELDGKRYLVENADWGGGGGRPEDHYPDGWELTIRPLGPKDVWSPRAKARVIYQKTVCLRPAYPWIKVVGHMKQTIKWEKA